MINDKIELISEINKSTLKEYCFSNIELKPSWNDKHGKKISSLCNKITCPKMWLVVGVEDDGSLSGHDESWAKATEEVISQSINRKLDPSLACENITCEVINSSWFVILELRNPGQVVKWENSAYKSSGSTSKKMTPEEIMQLTIELPGLTDYSKQIIERNVDEEIVSIFCQDIRDNNNDLVCVASNEELICKIQVHSTNAEKILLGQTKYRVVKTDKDNNIIENSTFYGLYKLLTTDFFEEIKQWFKQNNPKSEILSEKILRESLANTVAHAAYNENDGEVLIELYFDKLTISNLCFPEYAAFANKWFSRIHKAPNSFLMEALRIVKKVDELGRGKNIIFTESLKCGYRPPIVEITHVGRLDRWTLNIYCGTSDERNIRIYEKIKESYQDINKSLIAFALVLWRNVTVTKILDYFGKEEHKVLAEVLTDLNGPIFYYRDEDRIVLNRWVRLLLEEGCEAKSFTPFEEDGLYKFARDMRNYHGGYVTPQQLRRLANMSESSSERTLSCKILKKWEKEKKIKKIKQGSYQFTSSEEISRTERALKLLEDFEKHQKDKKETGQSI